MAKMTCFFMFFYLFLSLLSTCICLSLYLRCESLLIDAQNGRKTNPAKHHCCQRTALFYISTLYAYIHIHSPLSSLVTKPPSTISAFFLFTRFHLLHLSSSPLHLSTKWKPTHSTLSSSFFTLSTLCSE